MYYFPPLSPSRYSTQLQVFSTNKQTNKPTITPENQKHKTKPHQEQHQNTELQPNQIKAHKKLWSPFYVNQRLLNFRPVLEWLNFQGYSVGKKTDFLSPAGINDSSVDNSLS